LGVLGVLGVFGDLDAVTTAAGTRAEAGINTANGGSEVASTRNKLIKMMVTLGIKKKSDITCRC
jgi:hypothetical protein